MIECCTKVVLDLTVSRRYDQYKSGDFLYTKSKEALGLKNGCRNDDVYRGGRLQSCGNAFDWSECLPEYLTIGLNTFQCYLILLGGSSIDHAFPWPEFLVLQNVEFLGNVIRGLPSWS